MPARADGEKHTLTVQVAAEGPLAAVELIRNGKIVAGFDGEGEREWSSTVKISPFAAGDYLYVRVVQTNGGAAWSSPFFSVEKRAP